MMNNLSILVVDDDAVIRRAFSQIFAHAGYAVQTAESAEAALQIMRQNPVAILFLDLDLPGMNGVDLCLKVHQDWPCSIPIAVTGCSSIFELVRCREVGFEDYFCKPAGPKELLAAAAAAVAKLDRWKRRQEPARAKVSAPADPVVKKAKSYWEAV
jgi:DNA-binding response OmpR family regulator